MNKVQRRSRPRRSNKKREARKIGIWKFKTWTMIRNKVRKSK